MRKIGLMLAVVLLMTFLSGCSLETLASASYDDMYELSNVKELKSGCGYVWNPASDESIYDDIKKVNESPVFFKITLGDYNFKGEELSDTGEHPRTVWMNEENDARIPTVTSKDHLLYISDTQVPTEIVFERFGDYGYTIGVANLVADGGDHYFIPYAEEAEDEYKYYINLESDAYELSEFTTITRLYLDKVGDVEVRKESVSDGGTVLGLTKGKEYVCEFYTGTFYQDYLLKANIHTFCSFERFVSYDYKFLHSNCISITIPEYLKSGYYVVNGVGLFRYVADSDLAAFQSGNLDAINWNDPIIIYDEYGFIKYDPSTMTEEEYVESDLEEEAKEPEGDGTEEIEEEGDGNG